MRSVAPWRHGSRRSGRRDVTRRPFAGLALTAVVAGANAAPLAAQAADDRLVLPTRVETPPQIDGRLDDDVWSTATTVTRFIQMHPVEGAPATEATEVFMAYDSDRLYFGFYAHYTNPSAIRASRVERDQIDRDDMITVYFDPTGDRQRAYAFSVNGYGVQADSVIVGNQGASSSNGLPSGNATWDALFASAGRLVADGWTAEVAIPVKSLRYPPKGEKEVHRWGFQIARIIASKDEIGVAFPVTRSIAGFVSQLGVMDGIAGLSTSRNLEVLPTFTAIGSRTLDVAGGGHFANDSVAEGALNLKYGVTPNLTADFTVNPDFSQIESDRPQIEVNQRFPLLFPELRPFFLEGQDIFSVSAPINLLNTRTIVDPGYGAKLTGKVGNTSIGLLAASDEAPGKGLELGDPARGEAAQVNVARIRYDAYRESYVGTLITDRELMGSYSRVIGADGQFRLSDTDRQFFILFHSTQRALDGTEHSGQAFGTNYRHSGRHLSASAFAGFTDPGFRSDVGVVRRVDTRTGWIDLGYRWWPAGARVINWGPRLRYERNYNHEWELDDEIIRPGLDFTFVRNVRVGVGTERSLERFGGVDFWKWRYTSNVTVASSRRLEVTGDVSWGDQIRFVATPFLGRGLQTNVAAVLRPSSRLQSEVSVNVSRLENPAGQEVFDIRIYRAFTTYQFSERLLFRNISEYNTFQRTLAVNLLLTYRVNSGTVFFAGYDDHYQQGDRIDATLYPTSSLRQTNRAFFTKFSYLFRYGL